MGWNCPWIAPQWHVAFQCVLRPRRPKIIDTIPRPSMLFLRLAWAFTAFDLPSCIKKLTSLPRKLSCHGYVPQLQENLEEEETLSAADIDLLREALFKRFGSLFRDQNFHCIPYGSLYKLKCLPMLPWAADQRQLNCGKKWTLLQRSIAIITTTVPWKNLCSRWIDSNFDVSTRGGTVPL